MAKNKRSVDEILAEDRQRARARETARENSALKDQLEAAEKTIKRVAGAGKRALTSAYSSGVATGGMVAGLAGIAVFAVEWILSRFLPAGYETWGKYIVFAVSCALVGGGYMLAMPVLLWAGVISATLTAILWALGKFGIIPKNWTIQGTDMEIGGTDMDEEYVVIDETDLMEIGAAIGDDMSELETGGPDTKETESFFAEVDEWVKGGLGPLGLVKLIGKGLLLFGPRVVEVLRALQVKLKSKKKGGKANLNGKKPSEVLRTAMAVREAQNRNRRPLTKVIQARQQAALPAPAPNRAEIDAAVKAAIADKQQELQDQINALKRQNHRQDRREDRREDRRDERQDYREDRREDAFQESDVETFGVDEIDGVEGVDFDTVVVDGVERRKMRRGRRVQRRGAAAQAYADAVRKYRGDTSTSSDTEASTDEGDSVTTQGMTAEQAVEAAMRL